MTKKTEIQKNPEDENRLLSSEEGAILNQIASMEQPHRNRAQALLAINEGATQAEAGRQAGQTVGQVRYWLGKFRKERMSIFPEELLNQAQPDESDSDVSSADMPDPAQIAKERESEQEMEKASAKPRDARKAKKKSKKKPKKVTKKAKKTKKTKKAKKDKKAKKAKKSAKKSNKKKSKKKTNKKGKK